MPASWIAPATISDALASLEKTYPTLAKDLDGKEAKPMLFVDDEEVSLEKFLSDGAKVHLVWPVSGGCGKTSEVAQTAKTSEVCT